MDNVFVLIFIWVIGFLILREFFCWYFKINEISDYLRTISHFKIERELVKTKEMLLGTEIKYLLIKNKDNYSIFQMIKAIDGTSFNMVFSDEEEGLVIPDSGFVVTEQNMLEKLNKKFDKAILKSSMEEIKEIYNLELNK